MLKQQIATAKSYIRICLLYLTSCVPSIILSYESFTLMHGKVHFEISNLLLALSEVGAGGTNSWLDWLAFKKY